MADGLRGEESEYHIAASCPVCELCGQFNNLMTCGACKCAWYCSKEHQVSHWKAHKKECRIKRKAIQLLEDQKGAADFAQLSSCDPARRQIDNEAEIWSGHVKSAENTHTTTYQHSGSTKVNVSGKGTLNLPEMTGPTSQHQELPKGKRVGTTPDHVSRMKKTPNGKTPVKKTSSGVPEDSEDHQTKTIAEYVVKCMNDYGICVVDQFLGDELGSKALSEVLELQEAGVLKDGELISKCDHSKKIRGDQITWTESGVDGCAYIGTLIQRLDNLIMSCNQRLGKYDINGRTKVCILNLARSLGRGGGGYFTIFFW